MFIFYVNTKSIKHGKMIYNNVNNSLISYSNPYVTFVHLLTSHDGHLLKAVYGKFIQDCSVTQPINFP